MALAFFEDRAHPTSFYVTYSATTPGGTRTRFDLQTAVTNLPYNATSETAVQSYLKLRHPKCEISIINLEFR